MAKERRARMIRPAKEPTTPLPDSRKVEVQAKADDLIEDALKPRHVEPPPKTRACRIPSPTAMPTWSWGT